METLFIYLIKSSALTAAFFLAYYFLLRKETFFKSNRWFLLLGLVTSVVLPLVTFKKVVWIDPVLEDSNFAAVPITAITVAPAFEIDWWLVTALVYAIGIFIFFLKFVFDFGSLVKTLKGQPVKQQADFKLVEVTHNVSPFSYFNYIVYNSALYTEAELNNILEHEKVHCEQNHSADVLISRLFCILFWYNPFAWWYKKAILQNLEFIADSEALKNISDKKAYQITLLKVTTHENCVAITNHFYQSLIKKRIIMLNKNQSKSWQSWKYFFIVPALAAFMFYFQVKVIAQEKAADNLAKEITDIRGVETIVVDKNTTDAQLKEFTAKMKVRGINLKFSKLKRNNAGEIIAIKADYKDKEDHKGSYVISGDEPIKPVSIAMNSNGTVAFGNAKQINFVRNQGSGNNESVTEIISGNDDDSDSQTSTYSYSFDHNGNMLTENVEGPEPPEPPMPPIVVKTITNKNGKVNVSVNGETIEVDVDKIMADIDIDAIREEAEEQMEVARVQMREARPQMEKARKQMLESRSVSEESAKDMEDARREMADSRKEMQKARKELQEMRSELAKERAALQAKKK